MAENRDRNQKQTRPEPESGEPGGGAGRRDEVGGSGVYPASAGKAPLDSEVRTQAAWGQGDRGPAGYEDSGSSELFFYEAELRAAEAAEAAEARKTGKAAVRTTGGEPRKDTDRT